jgi:hypothetical protein
VRVAKRPPAPVTVRHADPQPAEPAPPAPEPEPAPPKVYGSCAWPGCEAPLFRWNRRWCDDHQHAGRLAGTRAWHARQAERNAAAREADAERRAYEARVAATERRREAATA